MKVVAYAALAASVPGLFLGGAPEAACSFLTATLAVFVLLSRSYP